MNLLVQHIDGARDLLPLAAADPVRYPALLESAARGGARARCDLLLLHAGERLVLGADGRLDDGTGQALDGGFLAALD
ncbi:MAG: aminodeoxychorismate synthase, component I, partial [Dokdonella sp.]